MTSASFGRRDEGASPTDEPSESPEPSAAADRTTTEYRTALECFNPMPQEIPRHDA